MTKFSPELRTGLEILRDQIVGQSYDANGITSAARYQQYSLKQAYHLSKRTTLYAVEAYQRASGQTLGSKGAGNIVEATPAVGDVIIIEGVVAIDRDIGAGYKFPTIVEDARILTTP